MVSQADSAAKDDTKRDVEVARSDEELNTEELEEVSGGTGAGKRGAYNAAQQPWQATID